MLSPWFGIKSDGMTQGGLFPAQPLILMFNRPFYPMSIIDYGIEFNDQPDKKLIKERYSAIKKIVGKGYLFSYNHKIELSGPEISDEKIDRIKKLAFVKDLFPLEDHY